MRRALCILAVLIVVIGVPSGRADSFTPTFTCNLCVTGLPIAPDVSIPASVTLDITWENTLFVLSLPSAQPTDFYNWKGHTPQGPTQFGTASFALFGGPDGTIAVTSPFVYEVDSNGNCLNCSVFDDGHMVFDPADAPSTPEPSSIFLMLAATGFLLVVMPKRLSQG